MQISDMVQTISVIVQMKCNNGVCGTTIKLHGTEQVCCYEDLCFYHCKPVHIIIEIEAFNGRDQSFRWKRSSKLSRDQSFRWKRSSKLSMEEIKSMEAFDGRDQQKRSMEAFDGSFRWKRSKSMEAFDGWKLSMEEIDGSFPVVSFRRWYSNTSLRHLFEGGISSSKACQVLFSPAEILLCSYGT
jgi:hypothetical protein